MAVSNNAIFVQTPVIDQCILGVANTNRSGAGALVPLAVGTTNGKRIDRIACQAFGTTTAGVIRMYINGVLQNEWVRAAVTPSTSVMADHFDAVFTPPITLPSGYVLSMSTHNAENWNVRADSWIY